MDDAKIVQLYWDRNEQAIPATADKYGNYCNSIAKNILGNKEDAEECVNDTYLNAWNSMPPHRPSILSTFLGKITRNLSIKCYKRNTADKRGGGQATVVLDEIAEFVSDTDSVEREIDRKELVKVIDDFLDRLPTDKKVIFVCRYWYFDSISDIAVRFGMTENNVSVTLNRLRLKLHTFEVSFEEGTLLLWEDNTIVAMNSPLEIGNDTTIYWTNVYPTFEEYMGATAYINIVIRPIG